MSSELLERLETEYTRLIPDPLRPEYLSDEDHFFNFAYARGFEEATKIVKEHEAKQMKDLNFIAFDDETEEHERLKEIISYLDLKDPMTVEERVKRMSAELDMVWSFPEEKGDDNEQ